MKALTLAATCLLTALSNMAQTATPTPGDDQKIVAVINGETITRARLEALYNGMPAPMRSQYERSGGKMAFLDNYLAKRLLIQEAIKSGFDKRPEVQAAIEAARDSAVYDRYVKEKIAPSVVSDDEARKFYEEHKSEFAIPESVKVRHIVISWSNKPKADAMDLTKRIMTEIRAGAPSPRDSSPENRRLLLERFSAAARRYSEDGVALAGGDLGWVARGALDKNFEDAAFSLKPMTMSGVIESQFGYHLIFVEETRPAGSQPFEQARADIREYLTTQHSAEVMAAVNRLTNELRASSKISFYPENVK